jgi:hypothetical protein
MSSPSRGASTWGRESPQRTSMREGGASTVGVVASVHSETGELTLIVREGVRVLRAGRLSLLEGVRLWRAVQVLTDGPVVRALRCL